MSLVLFFAGGISFVGLNTFFAYTNTNEFCTSCHSMRINYEEYKNTLHYKNAVGIKATCADCHVPKEFFPKLYAKIYAAKDVYHWILGTVDTKEKFDAHRWDMASRVWQKMRLTDSRECRTCHDYSDMDMSEQDRLARKKHTRAPLEGKTCIDCHTGLTHTEPLEPDEDEEEI
ncbi:MAG: NapC/NirT family cytochrome c [Gammaproteobacteria bacterium]|nr:NapC/NirT family cytochrome c [Gammaproteobacteria bacterium]